MCTYNCLNSFKDPGFLCAHMEVVFYKLEAGYQPVATSSRDVPRLQDNDGISKAALPRQPGHQPVVLSCCRTCSGRFCSSLLLSKFLRQHLTDVTLVFGINNVMTEMVGGVLQQ